MQEAEGHLSIDAIVEWVNAANPCVSLSTIYRNLGFLLDLGLIQEQHFPWHGTQAHYEVAQDANHHHLICQRCHAIVHFAYTFPASLQQELAQQYHFHVLKPTLLVKGICEVCHALAPPLPLQPYFSCLATEFASRHSMGYDAVPEDGKQPEEMESKPRRFSQLLHTNTTQ